MSGLTTAAIAPPKVAGVRAPSALQGRDQPDLGFRCHTQARQPFQGGEGRTFRPACVTGRIDVKWKRLWLDLNRISRPIEGQPIRDPRGSQGVAREVSRALGAACRWRPSFPASDAFQASARLSARVANVGETTG